MSDPYLFVRLAEKSALTASTSFIEEMERTMGVKIVMLMAYVEGSPPHEKCALYVFNFFQLNATGLTYVPVLRPTREQMIPSSIPTTNFIPICWKPFQNGLKVNLVCSFTFCVSFFTYVCVFFCPLDETKIENGNDSDGSLQPSSKRHKKGELWPLETDDDGHAMFTMATKNLSLPQSKDLVRSFVTHAYSKYHSSVL